MKTLRRYPLALPGRPSSGKAGLAVRPGTSLDLTGDLAPAPWPVQHHLRVVGEVDVHWRLRCEPGIPLHTYESLMDALDPTVVYDEPWSLRLTGHGEDFPRQAFTRLSVAGDLARPFRLVVPARTRDLGLGPIPGGEMGVELGVYRRRAGRSPEDVFDPPDVVFRVEVPPGTGEWRELAAEFLLPADAVCLLVRVGGRAFTGTVWLGTPRLFQEDFPLGGQPHPLNGYDSLIPPFGPPDPHWPQFRWLGENLSRQEWPEFDVTQDGQSVFRGPVFNAIFRSPDFMVPLGSLAAGRHEWRLTLCADYLGAPSFLVQHAELIEESRRPLEIVAYPDYVAENEAFAVLVERNTAAGSSLDVVHVPAGPARPYPVYLLAADGTVTTPATAAPEVSLQFCCPACGRRLTAALGLLGTSVLCDGCQATVLVQDEQAPTSQEPAPITPRRVVRRTDDGITQSTGDAIYVPQTQAAFHQFLSWYLQHQVGNSICFRPVYRWSGTRELNPAVWQWLRPLLEKLGLKYHLMVDGRELPGKAANPPDALLAGPNYLGRQNHEQDGAFCYWGVHPRDGLYVTLFQRSKSPGGCPATRPAVYQGHEVLSFINPHAAHTMQEAADYLVANLRQARGGATRHTGPSTLFRYFFQAGYQWLGAEQMYGAEEVVLAALRGASRAYGQPDYGAHLALQWNSTPLDAEELGRRYFLSLATCYLQGVSNINTEEGLWRMESEYAPYDRFSRCCERARAVHRRFRRFLLTHPRRGAMRVPLAVLQGRHCGWRCFARGGHVWHQADPQFASGPPEDSFDLLKVFYPRNVLDAIYRMDCPAAPQGWYSGTPFGPVDVLPVEAPARALGAYRALAFLGWNTFDENEFNQLAQYVEKGGILLLARPHLSTETRRDRPALIPDVPAVRQLVGDALTAPARATRQVGRGKVIFFPQEIYPAAAAIRAEYAAELAALGELALAVERERGWVRGSSDVNFAVYDWPDEWHRTIYLLNIDWWSAASAHRAQFCFGAQELPVACRAGAIETLSIAGDWAVWPEEADADVVAIREAGRGVRITVQSDAGATLRVGHRTTGEWRTVRVAQGGVSEVVVPNL